MVKSLDEVIERLQYKADNIKAKLEPSYFTECIDYLKTLPREESKNDIAYAVKDKDGHYFIGYNQWDKQVRKAKLYHSYRYAQETRDDVRFKERDAYIVRVSIMEIAEKMKGE